MTIPKTVLRIKRGLEKRVPRFAARDATYATNPRSCSCSPTDHNPAFRDFLAHRVFARAYRPDPEMLAWQSPQFLEA